jgi:hypothetical protein
MIIRRTCLPYAFLTNAQYAGELKHQIMTHQDHLAIDRTEETYKIMSHSGKRYFMIDKPLPV